MEVLGYVFLLVPLLAKYLEHMVRATLEKEDDALRVGGKKLARPATQAILYHFGTVSLLESGGKRFMPNPPEATGPASWTRSVFPGSCTRTETAETTSWSVSAAERSIPL
jgi:hypothetical protein